MNKKKFSKKLTGKSGHHPSEGIWADAVAARAKTQSRHMMQGELVQECSSDSRLPLIRGTLEPVR